MTDIIKEKHREKIMKEFKGEDYKKMTDSLLEMMGEVTDDAKLELGWSLLDLGEYKAGLALFSTLPWNTYGEAKFNGMGRTLIEMHCYDEARRFLKRGLQRFPKSCPLWVAMGGLYDALGSHSESLKCFETALRFASEKDYKSVCYNKAVVLVKLGCYNDAASIIEYLIEECPEDPKYMAERAHCAMELGYYQESLNYYQKAIYLYQRFPSIDAGLSIYSGLCSTYMGMGMRREAMNVAIEGLKRFPDEDSILYHNLGAVFCEMGWTEDARKVLKKGVEKFPDDEELKAFLKDVEDDLDDPPDGGELLGLLLLIAIIQKKMRKK